MRSRPAGTSITVRVLRTGRAAAESGSSVIAVRAALGAGLVSLVRAICRRDPGHAGRRRQRRHAHAHALSHPHQGERHHHLPAQRPVRPARPGAAQLDAARLAPRRADPRWIRACSTPSGRSTARPAPSEPIHIASAYRSPADQRDAPPPLERGGQEQPAHARQGHGLLPARTCRSTASGRSAMRMQHGGVGYYPSAYNALRPSRRRQRPRLAAHDPRPARAALP